MDPRDAFLAAARSIVETLLSETGASRTTLRLDEPSLALHIDDVTAEALAPGERSMRGEGTINHRAADTAQWVEAHRRLLVQDDLEATDFPAPLGLTHGFGVKAQMLAPVQREGRLDGWVSVHQAGRTRVWSEADKDAAERAARAVERLLGA